MRALILSLVVALGIAHGSEPTEIAVKTLEEIRNRQNEFTLPRSIMVSPFCGPRKRQIIKDQWKNISSWLRKNSAQISGGLEKIDGELAAVILTASPESSPDQVKAISLGLRMVDDQWRIAPVPGMFENAGLGFIGDVRSRAGELENWMSVERAGFVAKRKSKAIEEFNKQLAGAVEAELLSEENPEIVLGHFLSATVARDYRAALVWQGARERDELPPISWSRTIEATKIGLKGRDQHGIWKLLTSNQVMRVIVEGEGDPEERVANYLVSFVTDFQTIRHEGNIAGVRFHLTLTDAGWRVHLPKLFAFAHEEMEVLRNEQREEVDYSDEELALIAGNQFEIENEKLASDSPEILAQAISKDLLSGNTHQFLARVFREEEEKEEKKDDGEKEGDENEEEEDEVEIPEVEIEIPEVEIEIEGLDNNPKFKQNIRRQIRIAARGGQGNQDLKNQLTNQKYELAIKWWSKALGPGRKVDSKTLKIFQEEDLAVIVFEIPSANIKMNGPYQVLWVTEEFEGWVVLPGGVIDPYKPSLKEKKIALRNQVAKHVQALSKTFKDNLLKLAAVRKKGAPAVSLEKAKEAAQRWRHLLEKGSTVDLLKNSAVRILPKDSDDLLKNLKAMRRSAQASEEPDQLLGAKTFGNLTGVSMMVVDGRGLERLCPLIVVAETETGPRTIVDIELPYESNKGLEILNEKRLGDLKKELPKEDFESLKKLYDWHQKLAKEAWEEWDRSQQGLIQ